MNELLESQYLSVQDIVANAFGSARIEGFDQSCQWLSLLRCGVLVALNFKAGFIVP